MKKHVLTLFLIVGMCLTLVACNDAGDDSSNTNTDSVKATESKKDKGVGEKSTDDDKPEQKDETGKELSIPDDIPKDFPFPEGMVITNISDKSDEEKIGYYIDINLENIDVVEVFDMYREYSEKIGYMITKDGEVESVPGVFQFATLKTSTDMFIITLRPEEENGMIQVLVGK
ncbi:hypothetical protein ACFSFY_12555 [Sporosarcina siberiensis]|uniref:Lipoprotein n=1 Tax=Sporosarcina siberiensis TaxID=1365606 RepID=A0ABW4SIP7_9BACL